MQILDERGRLVVLRGVIFFLRGGRVDGSNSHDKNYSIP